MRVFHHPLSANAALVILALIVTSFDHFCFGWRPISSQQSTGHARHFRSSNRSEWYSSSQRHDDLYDGKSDGDHRNDD